MHEKKDYSIRLHRDFDTRFTFLISDRQRTDGRRTDNANYRVSGP